MIQCGMEEEQESPLSRMRRGKKEGKSSDSLRHGDCWQEHKPHHSVLMKTQPSKQ